MAEHASLRASGAPRAHRALRRSTLTAVAMGAVLLLLIATPALATPGQVTEFPLSSPGQSPNAIAAGPDGALWFTEQAFAVIGRFDGHSFTYFPLPAHQKYANDITAGPDGALWFSDAYDAEVGRISTTGQVTEFRLPPCNCGPDNLGATSITAGPDGALWYARFASDVIGRITTQGVATEFPVSYGPSRITSGPDGALWYTDETGIGRMAVDGTNTQFDTPFTYPLTIATGPDGNLWTTFPYSNVVGRVTPDGAMKFFQPDDNCSPQEIASGAGALWFSCYNLFEIERLSTTGSMTRIPIPSQVPSYSITSGPGRAMWFTETSANKLARISTR